MGKRRVRTERGRIIIDEDMTWMPTCYEVTQKDTRRPVLAATHQRSPEDEAINRDLLRKTSREALDVLRLIYNAPDEVMQELVNPELGHVTQDRLAKHLKFCWCWPEIKAKAAWAELRRLTQAMV